MFYAFLYHSFTGLWGFPGGSEVKASASSVGDLGSFPGSGRSPEEGNGNPLQYSCLENPMDGEAWQATVHRVAKSWTRLSDFTSLHFKETKDLYIENYKTLMKEINDDTNRWRYTMYTDWKNQYNENEYTTQSNLQIQ